MNSVIKILNLSLFCLAALGFSPAEADELSTDLGFHRIDVNSPSAITKTSASVFEIRIPSAGSPSEVRIVDLTSPNFKDIDGKIDRLQNFDRLDKIVIKKQIERCRRDHTESQCAVLFGIAKATGFLTGGDGSYLVTNAHVVDGFLQLLRAYSPEKTIVDIIADAKGVPVFLFDKDGNLAFDPYESGAQIIRYGRPSSLSQAQNTWFAEDSDYVVIKLGRIIGKPIPIAKSATAGQAVWHVGYPACTGCERNPDKIDPALNTSRKTFGDSDGVGFYWTPAGKILSLQEAKEHLNTTTWFSNLLDWHSIIFFNVDAQVGMSGGPILNTNGEAVGVYAGSKPLIDGRGKMNIISRGIRPKEFDLVQ